MDEQQYIFKQIDLNAIEAFVASYVQMRFALVSQLRTEPISHSRFIQFCNDQSTLLNRVLGTLDENALRQLARVVTSGIAPLSSPILDEAFLELLLCQIAYLGILRERTAGQN